MPRKFPLEKGFPLILSELGIDGAEVIARSGLSPMLFRQSTVLLTGPEHMQVWQAVVDASSEAQAMLAVASLATTTTFNPILFACSCSPTYEIAVERLRTHKLLLGPMGLRVDHTSDTLIVTPEPSQDVEHLPDSLAAAEIAFQKALIDLATRCKIKPYRVVLPKILTSDIHVSEFFGLQTEVGAEVSITFALEDARRPFLTQDSSMWDYFEPELRRRLSDITDEASAVEVTRGALLELLPTGEAAIGAVAKHLALSPRTLQRMLNEVDILD